ncbi:hypothetical protein MVEG_05817 [Podila verticillata NRRL 6337]|nr:hypothetical protein MVEG_05817 [Podila verticillata NRRL 6337]
MSSFPSDKKQIQQHALHIPEVLEAIFACSNKHHIHHFSLVCRQWYRVTRRFSSTVLIWQDTMDLKEQMSRLNHLHRSHILDCTADLYGAFKSDMDRSSTLQAEKHRLAAWEFLRAKIVEQSRVVRHTTTTILSALHGIGNKGEGPAPGSILLDSIPLQELVIRGNITLESSIVPVLRELSTLRSLKLVKINLTKVDLQLILDSFPELVELEMAPVTINYAPLLEASRDFVEATASLVDREETTTIATTTSLDSVAPRQFPLQRFRIQHFAFYQDVLESYLRAMPDLTDLRLIDLLRYTPRPHYPYGQPLQLRPYDRLQILDAIASSCPNLRCFQLSFDFGDYSRHLSDNTEGHTLDLNELATRLPSSIENWAFSERDMSDPPILQLHHACFDRLTTLEVTKQRQEYVPTDKFHKMLCTNESLATLRHLKILGFVYDLKYLKMDMPLVLDRTYGANHPLLTLANGDVDVAATAIASTLPAVYPDPERETVHPYWKCRNLLTLHIHLGKDDPINSHYETPASELHTRRPLSYIAKLCPNLQELRIQKHTLAMGPLGGLCQLTELEDLEQLVLDLTHVAPVAEKDLAWMRQTFATSKSASGGSGGGSWKIHIPWRFSSSGSAEKVAAHQSLDDRTRRRRGEHEPLSVKEAHAVGEVHEVKRVLKKLELGEVCWPHLESFKVQIHWTHAANMKEEQLQKRLPHVLCRVRANVLGR